MTHVQALIEAIDILRDEANSLACVQTEEHGKHLAHRAKIAIQREWQRFHEIADALDDPSMAGRPRPGDRGIYRKGGIVPEIKSAADLRTALDRVIKLLSDPQPGLAAWASLYGGEMSEIVRWWESN